MKAPPCPALVLSGGGVRGAYEAGVLAGLVEVLGLGAADRAPFSIFAGASVGAINVAYLAANAHRGHMNVEGLVDIWARLDLQRYLKFDPMGFFGVKRQLKRLWHFANGNGPPPRIGRSLLDGSAVEGLVRDGVDWERLHDNIDNGRIRSLIVAALDVATGTTHMFAELAEGAEFRPSRDPRRVGHPEPITADHVLASAAIPMVFPARRIDGRYFADGGLRFNTPMAPAIRSGADRLCVVSLQHTSAISGRTYVQDPPVHPIDHTRDYPSPFFLLGKLLNALLLDSIVYDLLVLDRFNKLIGVLEETLTAEELERVQQVIVESRGVRYRTLETLVFTPSKDIGVLAGEYLTEHMPNLEIGPLTRWFLSRMTRGEGHESDLASYILFDGGFTSRLIELGRHDAHDKADEIREFFGDCG